MRTKEIRALSVELRRKYRIRQMDYGSICSLIESFGYTIIEYDRFQNDDDVSVVIEKLDLTEYIVRHMGFTYADSNCRLVFVQAGLDEEEKTIILSHELGHIACNHLTHAPILGMSVFEEDEANQFAQYLLRPLIADVVRIDAAIYRKQIVVICCLLISVAILISIVFFEKKQATYCGNYYVTENGDKYHKAECMFIKDKKNARRLTIEEYEAEKYAPCQMCLPD